MDWFRHERSPEAYRQVFEALTPEEQEVVAGEILPNVWYDAETTHRLLERVLGSLPPDEQKEVARGAARSGLRVLSRGIYKFVLERLVSPAMYARNVQRLFRMLHDTGDREIEVGAREALSITRSWAGHHPLSCLMVNETTAAVFETLGCRNVTTERVACVSEGDRDCRCRLRWE